MALRDVELLRNLAAHKTRAPRGGHPMKNEIRLFTPYLADEGDPALILALCHEHSLSAYDAS